MGDFKGDFMVRGAANAEGVVEWPASVPQGGPQPASHE
jgi:hypothetical protein